MHTCVCVCVNSLNSLLYVVSCALRELCRENIIVVGYCYCVLSIAKLVRMEVVYTYIYVRPIALASSVSNNTTQKLP